jgi:hypothetical protein
MLLFHALLTHNIPRYNAPLVPFFVISMLLAFQFAIRRLFAAVTRMSGATHSVTVGETAG